MTEQKNDGGPAFPIPHSSEPGAYEAHPGMTLRDYTAIQALAGLLASSDMTVPANAETFEAIVKHFAEVSYAYADAMLAARAKQ